VHRAANKSDATDMRSSSRPECSGALACCGLLSHDAAEAVLAGREMRWQEVMKRSVPAADLIDKAFFCASDNSVLATCPLIHMLEPCARTRSRAQCCCEQRREWMDWCAIALPKPRSPPKGSSDLRRPMAGPRAGGLRRATAPPDVAYRAGPSRRKRPNRMALSLWMIRGHAAEGLGW